MSDTWRKLLGGAAGAATLVAAAVVLAGCGQSGSQTSGGSTVSAGNTVNAELGEFYIKLDRTSVPAGKVTFKVTNSGKIEHELIVLKTDLAVDKLPMRANDPSKVDEDAAGGVGEIEDVAAGQSKNGTFDLKSGSYVLICNVSGHYAAGQRIAFRVS